MGSTFSNIDITDTLTDTVVVEYNNSEPDDAARRLMQRISQLETRLNRLEASKDLPAPILRPTREVSRPPAPNWHGALLKELQNRRKKICPPN